MDPLRRRLLQRATALGAAAFLRPAFAAAVAAPKFKSYPFTLGVASGDPLADGFVIWTRTRCTSRSAGSKPAAIITTASWRATP